MAEAVIPIETRTALGTRAVRRLRKQGRIPAILYGEGVPPTPIQCRLIDLEKALQSGAHMVTLDGPDGIHRVLVKHIQPHPVSGKVLHVDFHKVSLTEKLEIEVPLVVKGDPSGVKEQGGVLETPVHTLKVRALPNRLPDRLEVDVSHLKLNERLRLGEVPKPEGVELLGNEDLVVAACLPPREEKEAAPEAAEAAATPGTTEPEVIKKAKSQEEAPGNA